MLPILVLALPSVALAQSAGDRQYADPLVTDGGGQSGQQSPPAATRDDAGAPEPPPTPSPTPDDASATANSEAPAAGALPRTGAEPLELAGIGAVLTACGALGLALPRRARHARR